jgi:hypothetical protein
LVDDAGIGTGTGAAAASEFIFLYFFGGGCTDTGGTAAGIRLYFLY